jgi:ATP-binding cassette subfamily B multidrug efflux pump
VARPGDDPRGRRRQRAAAAANQAGDRRDIATGDAIGLRFTAMLFLGAVMAEFFASAIQVYALQRVGYVTISTCGASIFRHVLRLPARFYDKTPIGSLLSRSTSDVEALSETLAFGVFTILTDIAVILSIVAAMFVLDARLTLISLAVAPVLTVIVRYFSGRCAPCSSRSARPRACRAATSPSSSPASPSCSCTAARQATVRRVRAPRRPLPARGQAANWYDASLYSLMDGISRAVRRHADLLRRARAVPRDAAATGVTLGLLFAFIDYLQRVFVPIREFSGKLATIQRAVASLERIYGLFDEPAEVRAAPGAPDPLQDFTGGVASATSASATAPTAARSCAASPSTSPPARSSPSSAAPARARPASAACSRAPTTATPATSGCTRPRARSRSATSRPTRCAATS